MSVEHMRANRTLTRNIEMSYEIECGASIRSVSIARRVKPSSVRSSVKRVRNHLMHFIEKFPNELRGQDARRHAYKAFADHVGVPVSLSRKTGAQRDLF